MESFIFMRLRDYNTLKIQSYPQKNETSETTEQN